MWFIGVEVVEQKTSAPPPKKNPVSAPELVRFLVDLLTNNSNNQDHGKVMRSSRANKYNTLYV